MTASDIPVPVISVAALGTNPDEAAALNQACRKQGFFYIVDHGIDQTLTARLEQLSRVFFELPLEDKLNIRMELAGHVWRGYFPVGAEQTSGLPDQKEGLYFGTELPDSHPKVQARVPLHGANLFPDINGFRETVLTFLDQMTTLGHTLLRGIAAGLGLDAHYFEDHCTTDPLVLFRIFHYPPLPSHAAPETMWSVGEHTDYGLLTILRQDHTGGLQIKTSDGWIEAPPVDNSFVCNIGDMLERMTGGLFRSTPHRVLNRQSHGRISFPFFFDPNWDATVTSIPALDTEKIRSAARWDHENVFDFRGTYGDYVLRKVSRVFPDLDHSG